jgi:AraC family transcriptional regulator of adaptative response / methylphosphotriester-DNA alkyltransferase methyltransferase
MSQVTHRPSTIRGRRELYETVMARLGERLSEPDLQIHDIAADTFASRRQIQRVMEEQRTTFRAELANLRMDRAAELLVSTSLPVREVAARVGYRQPAQFAKAFRLRHGSAPSAYRQENAGRDRSPWATAA